MGMSALQNRRALFMKKAIVMAGVLFALTMTAGCGSQNQDHAATAESDVTENEEEALQDNENTEKSSKVLVAYYSATGNTKAAAETIADAAGGELFELQPAEAYTTEDLDYNDPESRVCKEHEDPDLQDVKLEEVTPESFPNADVVFLGYPIWWGEAAWPVNEFVKENDFTGKTVIPFCTSASSGLGDSGENLAEMAGTGDWQEGKRFSSGVSEEEIQNWIGSLDLSAK
jgi:flavodoxin